MEGIDNLMQLAKEAYSKAYAPYSKFYVGAAILTEKGNIYQGCNVENASYGLTSCAERNAIFTAVQDEGPDMKLKIVAVDCADDAGAGPCGACRQVIHEFSTPETYVAFYKHGSLRIQKMSDLLPDSFSLDH